MDPSDEVGRLPEMRDDAHLKCKVLYYRVFLGRTGPENGILAPVLNPRFNATYKAEAKHKREYTLRTAVTTSSFIRKTL